MSISIHRNQIKLSPIGHERKNLEQKSVRLDYSLNVMKFDDI